MYSLDRKANIPRRRIAEVQATTVQIVRNTPSRNPLAPAGEEIPFARPWTVETDSQSRKKLWLQSRQDTVPSGTYPVAPAHASRMALHLWRWYVLFRSLYPVYPTSTLVTYIFLFPPETPTLSLSVQSFRGGTNLSCPSTVPSPRLSTFIKPYTYVRLATSTSASASPPIALPSSLLRPCLAILSHQTHSPPVYLN